MHVTLLFIYLFQTSVAVNIILFIYFSHLGCEYNFIIYLFIYLFQRSVAVNIILFISVIYAVNITLLFIYLFISDICCCEYNFIYLFQSSRL